MMTSPSPSASTPEDSPRASAPKTIKRNDHLSRVPQACEQCRSRKIKCNGKTPCDQCTSHSRTCLRAAGRKPRDKGLKYALVRISIRKIMAVDELDDTGANKMTLFFNQRQENQSARVENQTARNTHHSKFREGETIFSIAWATSKFSASSILPGIANLGIKKQFCDTFANAA